MALLKRESDAVVINDSGEVEQQLNIKETYQLLLRIIMMKPIRILAVVLLTVKAGLLNCSMVFTVSSVTKNFFPQALLLVMQSHH